MAKSDNYYWGDFFTKVGSGMIAASLTAFYITKTIEIIPSSAFIFACFLVYIGYDMIKREKQKWL